MLKIFKEHPKIHTRVLAKWDLQYSDFLRIITRFNDESPKKLAIDITLGARELKNVFHDYV